MSSTFLIVDEYLTSLGSHVNGWPAAAVARNLAERLDDNDEKSAAAVAKQLLATLAGIDARVTAANAKGDAVDDLASRRAARRA